MCSGTRNCIGPTTRDACASPAAALAEFYEAKEKIDLFIVVSDEGENTACRLRNSSEPTVPVQPGPYSHWGGSSTGSSSSLPVTDTSRSPIAIA